jgi:hypothetical protein
MPGWHMVPGTMTGHGLNPPDELRNNPLSNGAWILSAILDQAGQAMKRHSNGLLLNYSELPEALESKLAIHFGLDLSTQDAETLRAIAGRHSKHRHVDFKPDAAEKRAVADTHVLELTDRWLDKPYRLLEQLRMDNATNLPSNP